MPGSVIEFAKDLAENFTLVDPLVEIGARAGGRFRTEPHDHS
jgi:hypothetical protein